MFPLGYTTVQPLNDSFTGLGLNKFEPKTSEIRFGLLAFCFFDLATVQVSSSGPTSRHSQTRRLPFFFSLHGTFVPCLSSLIMNLAIRDRSRVALHSHKSLAQVAVGEIGRAHV